MPLHPPVLPTRPSLRRLLAAAAAVLLVAACDPPETAERGVQDPPAATGPGRTPTGDGGTPAASPSPEAPAATTPATPTPTPTPRASPRPGATGGVTAEPCPAAVNAGNGCIYLGALEDREQGPLAALGAAHTEARTAFWERVNAAGGIAGYDVDVWTYERDTRGDPERHADAFAEIRDQVLALAQSQGVAATGAILPALADAGMLAVPASPVSAWVGEEHLATAGASTCVDAANGVDHVAEAAGGLDTVAVLHYPGAYGQDALAGAGAAARRHGARMLELTVSPDAAAAVPGLVDAALEAGADVLLVATGPAELGAIVDHAAGAGFSGLVLGMAPTWDRPLLRGRAEALVRHYRLLGPWAPWTTGSAGHAALRAALRGTATSEAHVAGWARQYPLAAAIATAADAGDLTPEGVRAAAADAGDLDGEGLLPPDAGAPDGARHSMLAAVDPAAPTGLRTHRGFFAGETARDLELPCRVPD